MWPGFVQGKIQTTLGNFIETAQFCGALSALVFDKLVIGTGVLLPAGLLSVDGESWGSGRADGPADAGGVRRHDVFDVGRVLHVNLFLLALSETYGVEARAVAPTFLMICGAGGQLCRLAACRGVWV